MGKLIDRLVTENANIEQPRKDQFDCECGGAVREVRPDYVEHACKRKYSHLTSYYDGIERFATYRRVQVTGTDRYNWFFDWK